MGKIYFWNYKKLAAALRIDAISKNQFIIYVLCFCVALAVNFKSSIQEGHFLLVLVGIIMGWSLVTIVPYIINRKGDNKNFWKRFVCLSLPILIRMIVIIFVTSILYVYLTRKFMADSLYILNPETNVSEPSAGMVRNNQIFAMAVTIGTMLYALWLYIKGFRIASGQEDTNADMVLLK